MDACLCSSSGHGTAFVHFGELTLHILRCSSTDKILMEMDVWSTIKDSPVRNPQLMHRAYSISST